MLRLFLVFILVFNLVVTGQKEEKNIKISGDFLNNNITIGNYPLKVPPAILSHFTPEIDLTKKHKNKRQKRQLSPGVYSCGHQVLVHIILTLYFYYRPMDFLSILV